MLSRLHHHTGRRTGGLGSIGSRFALGAFVEWATGMGTSFGLGMYLPTPATFPMLLGGAARDWWEKKTTA